MQSCFSKLALGTVQFGIDYGITNKLGQISSEEVRAILDFASKLGISTIDTAHLYGDSEKVLGSTDLLRNFNIITKTPYFENIEEASDILLMLRKAYEKSKSYLQQKAYGLLVHNGNDLLGKSGKILHDELLRMKEEHEITKIGVSVYSPNQCEKIIDQFAVDIVQLPISVYDQRFIKTGLVQKLSDMGVEVHARSVFLQGLLLEQELSNRFSKISQLHSSFVEFCGSIGKSQLLVSYMFVSNLSQVARTVIGFCSKSQLEELVLGDCFELNLEEMSRFSVEDEAIVNPSLWAND